MSGYEVDSAFETPTARILKMSAVFTIIERVARENGFCATKADIMLAAMYIVEHEDKERGNG